MTDAYRNHSSSSQAQPEFLDAWLTSDSLFLHKFVFAFLRESRKDSITDRATNAARASDYVWKLMKPNVHVNTCF